MKTRAAIVVVVAAAVTAAHSQSIDWKYLGKQGDARLEWASNVVDRDAFTVATFVRFVYDNEDRAPNNATFDNKRIGVRIRCSEQTYFVLGQSYSKGDREVYSESLATVGSYQPLAGSAIQSVAAKTC